MSNRVILEVERMSIPTYPISTCVKIPMFNENRNHQGTKGNPYPVLPVLSVTRTDCKPVEYEVVRMENDYIKLIIIPALGGRIFEAYDKVNHYDFLYRQHVIKPALIGAYGLWISGGLEFNWPFHHRPSTFMPVNFKTEVQNDGTAITWLSECDPTDRMIQTIGIVLQPDSAFFETRILTTNRTPVRHSFLSWENAAVPVNDNYQFIFPPDVNYVNNHYSMSKPPMTYPIAKGRYSSANYDEPTDITWYKNCADATSHFAAPSKYDFFGGYDHGKQCGIIHIADHHVSPGKKMFTWGTRTLAKNWEKALTDDDGPYCELMAGSYSNNQPDFAWLNPYETKQFSEYWYPVGAVGKTSFATLEASVSIQLNNGTMRMETTRPQKSLRVQLTCGDAVLVDTLCNTVPCVPVSFSFPEAEGMYTVAITTEDGKEILYYAQEKTDELQYPEPVQLDPHPDTIASVQDLYLQGVHVDQYRHCAIKPSIYYQEALRRDPNHIPSLTALGEYEYRNGFFAEAEKHLQKAVKRSHVYNSRAIDEEAEYLLALAVDEQGREDEAYDLFNNAAWSGITAAKALTKAAAIDGRKKKYREMHAHSISALEHGSRNPVAASYAALAEWKLGNKNKAMGYIAKILELDPLNDLASYILNRLSESDIDEFWSTRRSDCSQIALDVAFDLIDAGFMKEAKELLVSVKDVSTPVVWYVLAYLNQDNQEICGDLLKKAFSLTPKNVYPYRLWEIHILEWVVHTVEAAEPCDLLACVLYDKGHYDYAMALWQKAVRLNDTCALYHRNLAVALFSHGGKKREAISLLEKAISLEPQNQQYLIEYLYASTKAGTDGMERIRVIDRYPVLGRKMDDFVLEHAKAWCIAGDYNKALEVMLNHSFVPAEGGEMAINNLYFCIRMHQALASMNQGENVKALEILSDIENLPKNLNSGLWAEYVLAPFYYYRAEVLKALGHAEEALSFYKMTLKRFTPTMPQMAYYYANAMRALGRKSEAQIYLSRVVRSLNEKINHKSIGYEDFTSAFNSYMNDPEQQRQGMYDYWRGMISLAEGNKDEARKLLEESRNLWPENLETWVHLDCLR